MSDYTVVPLESIEPVNDGRCAFRPIRHQLGIGSFGVNAFTGVEVGDRIINEHDEKDEHEELYLVHSGRARFEIGGETVDAPVGTLVYARPGVLRTAFAEEPNTILIAMGGEPGKVYQAHGFEIWAPLDPLFKAGRYEEVAALGKPLADAYPQYAMAVYNIACCEALAGHPEDAIAHLRSSIERNPDVKEWAAGDSDLDSLREDPRFQELFAVGRRHGDGDRAAVELPGHLQDVADGHEQRPLQAQVPRGGAGDVDLRVELAVGRPVGAAADRLVLGVAVAVEPGHAAPVGLLGDVERAAPQPRVGERRAAQRGALQRVEDGQRGSRGRPPLGGRRPVARSGRRGVASRTVSG